MSIQNHHARPRRRRASMPAPATLPELVEEPWPADRLPWWSGHPGSLEYSWDNAWCWRLGFRCRYRGGRVDQGLRLRSVIADSRERAVKLLREMMARDLVETIYLHKVWGPLRVEQIAGIRAMNEELDRMKKAESTKSMKDAK